MILCVDWVSTDLQMFPVSDKVSNKFSFLLFSASIFKKIFHKTDNDETQLKCELREKTSNRRSKLVTKDTPETNKDGSTSSSQCTNSSSLSSVNMHKDKESNNRMQHAGKAGKHVTDKKRKKTLKQKKKKNFDFESEREDGTKLEGDYSSLFDETRVACVTIENVEGEPEYGLFTEDDALSDLIANNNYEDIVEIDRTRLDGEIDRTRLGGDSSKQSAKNNPSSNVRYNYDCFKCGKKFRNRAPLNLHIASEHNEDGGLGLLCNDCGKQVDYDHELDLHKKFFCKKVKKSFKCTSCKLSFISEVNKDEHPCTKDPIKPYYCIVQDCQTNSRNVKDLTEHVTRHLGIKPFLCNICGRAFSAKKDMDRHADIHKDSKDYICQVCGQSFKSYHTMRRHVFVHKFKDRFKCDQCPYTTAMRNSFNQHLIKHRQRTHKCQICEKNLRSAKSLAKHVQNRHTFNRIFTCRYCDFTTDVGLSYSSHMRNHRGLKDIHTISRNTKSQDMPLDLSEQGQTCCQFNSLSTNRDSQEMMATKLHSNLTLTMTSASMRDMSTASMLADAVIPVLDHEDMNISGQNADAIMANIVESSETHEIAVIPPETSTNLVLYTVDVPAAGLNVSNFISGPVTTSENWTDDVTR